MRGFGSLDSAGLDRFDGQRRNLFAVFVSAYDNPEKMRGELLAVLFVFEFLDCQDGGERALFPLGEDRNVEPAYEGSIIMRFSLLVISATRRTH